MRMCGTSPSKCVFESLSRGSDVVWWLRAGWPVSNPLAGEQAAEWQRQRQRQRTMLSKAALEGIAAYKYKA